MLDAEPSPASENKTKPKPKGPGTLIFVAFALFFVIFGSCAAYFLWPRGEMLGTIDLRARPAATLPISVGAGDKLNFRMGSIVVGTVGLGYPDDSSKSRANKVREELRLSRITVAATGNDGVSKASTECGAYADKLTTGSSDSDSVTSSGLPLECSITVEKAGDYTLTAKVEWVPKDVRSASLEVRREKASK